MAIITSLESGVLLQGHSSLWLWLRCSTKFLSCRLNLAKSLLEKSKSTLATLFQGKELKQLLRALYIWIFRRASFPRQQYKLWLSIFASEIISATGQGALVFFVAPYVTDGGTVLYFQVWRKKLSLSKYSIWKLQCIWSQSAGHEFKIQDTRLPTSIVLGIIVSFKLFELTKYGKETCG